MQHSSAEHTRRSNRASAWASVFAFPLVVGCGLQGFNSPPGPNAPPEPLQCDTATIATSTLPVWKETTLSATYNACAGCHIAGDPLGAGGGWGVANDTSDEGWHWATLQLMARDAAAVTVDAAPFYAKFNDFDPTHPANVTAQGELATVYNQFRTSGGTACAAGPVLDGDCENPSFAKFVELSLGTSINTCATCHFSGTPTGRGINWGNGNDPSAEAWYLAVRGLQLQADQVELATQSTSLYTHFSPGNAQHPKNDTLATQMGTWVDTFRSTGEGDCTGEPEPEPAVEPEPSPEPEPVPEPEPLPPAECLTDYDPVDAQAYFDSTLKTPMIQCSSCHRAGPNVNNGDLRFIEADVYAITLALIANDADLLPRDTLMGKILRVPGSTPLVTHNYVYTQPDAAAEWLTRMNFGVEIENCGDAGVALCAAPYPAAESESYFAAELNDAFFSCSSCHRLTPGGVNGNTSFDATSGYAAALATLNADALPAPESRIGQILRVPGSTPLASHNYGFTKGDQALTWIENHRGGYEAPCP